MPKLIETPKDEDGKPQNQMLLKQATLQTTIQSLMQQNTKELQEKLQDDLEALRADDSAKPPAWREMISFLRERILNKNDLFDLENNCVYYILNGKVALGKKIIDSTEFIFGVKGRSITALQNTSLIIMHLTIQK